MKRLLCLYLISFAFFISFSQELAVRDFYLDQKDITGSSYYRTDANGEYCSLIVVQTNLQGIGMTFSGNIVGSIEERNGDYWVYVTNGTKRLHARCPNYLPVDIEFDKFGVENTDAKRTYKLNVIGQNIMSYSPTVETKMQSLIINYTPANAKLKINNEEMESSNGLFKIKYPVGKYTYELSAPGYISESKLLDLTSASPVNIAVSLETITESQENQLRQAEELYQKGISLLHLGQDESAEQNALKCIELGYEKGYGIITALQLLGYYDDGKSIPVVVDNLYAWQMKRYHLSGKDLLERRYLVDVE